VGALHHFEMGYNFYAKEAIASPTIAPGLFLHLKQGYH
jgi:hypothetical protein